MVLLLRRRRGRVFASASDPAAGARFHPDERVMLRSYALDALSEAVLLTDHDGRVRDCNSSALSLFDRDRRTIEDQFASSLRRFEGLNPDDPYRVAAERTIWTGEAWSRQPDGGTRLCSARVVAIRDGQARVTGFVESFRDVMSEGEEESEVRNLLYGVRALDPIAVAPGDKARALRREVYFLSEAFRDLDLVVRQCERLLPTLAADDPLTEAVAGAAHDVRAAMAAVGMPALLEEVPRSLARLRGHLQQLAPGGESAGSDGEVTNASPVLPPAKGRTVS